MRKVNQNMPTAHSYLLLDSRYQNTKINRLMMLENVIILIVLTVYFNIKQYKICLA